jgi:hypothetical protein
MSVTSVQVLDSVDAEIRAKVLRKIVTYRVVVNSRTDGPDAVTGSTNIPTINVSTYVSPFKYGDDVNNSNLICRELRNVRKVVNWNGSVAVWQLDAEFLFDRDLTLAQKGVSVQPITRQVPEVVNTAQFVGWFKPKSTLSKNFDVEADTAITDANSPAIKLNQLGPISNSAGTPVVPGIEETVGKFGLIVKWSKLTPIDYSLYLGQVNSASITITDTHGTFNRTFATDTIRLVAADQTPRDLFGVTVYDVSLEFDFPEFAGDHFELDRGVGEFMQTGDSDGRGGTYASTTELPPNKIRPLVGADGQPISQPIPFDGKGRAIDDFTPSKARYLRFKKRPSVSFASLGIGVYT